VQQLAVPGDLTGKGRAHGEPEQQHGRANGERET
jgi:hypothetical protein